MEREEKGMRHNGTPEMVNGKASSNGRKIKDARNRTPGGPHRGDRKVIPIAMVVLLLASSATLMLTWNAEAKTIVVDATG
ncbi:MAG: hypothetical protein J7L61_04555, partial [Thermoplasmata archaeon]|nr:hypothetical protein [Thermoplasmata archaeon]